MAIVTLSQMSQPPVGEVSAVPCAARLEVARSETPGKQHRQTESRVVCGTIGFCAAERNTVVPQKNAGLSGRCTRTRRCDAGLFPGVPQTTRHSGEIADVAER